MEAAFNHFHTIIDVFLPGNARTPVMAKANALRMEVLKKRKVDKDRNAECLTL
jgi:hypothetical protein